jgi:hypothetical protein
LELDWPSEVFTLAYDPVKVTPERMLETVRAQGLEGELVPERGDKARP